MIPRVGERVQRGRRYVLRPGAYAILRRGGLVLLTHQARPLMELQLPGGGIDPGEQPVAALHREVYEETGWTMRLQRRLGAFRRFTYMPDYDLWAEKLCTVYLGRPGRQLGWPSEPEHMPVWLPIAEAAESLGNAGDRSFMRSLL
ncbi:NUDIX domain-containing protein [Tropicimonas isoalkanivorans]|uniref:8-oxo-dGTP diphosphatase n=1 Tax=Tropicimonas isoalkanivorans TaxID=441112 RepID=A0A1I1LY43_9RHOB|nr:NUDIX hydrolase [Tropicimonas isoalkanivorans]SFC78041.1 8-oxo-dGTP diphosphatase [Tropicimonas isoalkanivorans]